MKITFALLLILVLTFPACKENEPNNNKKDAPNIVFLFTDDQTYGSVHALGNDEIITPNLDRLVNQGTTFTHAYNMGGWHGAVCVASRSMIISGSYIWNAKKKDSLWNKKDSIALTQNWSKLLQDRGYSTYMTGKWHVQAPADQIFDRAEHIRPGMPRDRGGELRKGFADWKKASGDMKDWNDYMPVGYGRPVDERDTEWSPTDSIHGGFWEGGKHWSEVVRDDAIDFIANTKTHGNPYFMYLAFNAPHDPRQAPQEYLDMYPIDSIKVPESFLPEYPYKDSINNPAILRDEALAPFPRTEYAIKKQRQEYYAIITHLDEQIGQILDALETTGEMDNTYIFFSSDHGLSVGQHGLMGKQSLFDHSIRVPMMVKGPDVPQGLKIDSDVYLQDIMATSLELAGAEKPDYVQFHSLMDLIKGDNTEGHYNAIYGAYMNAQRMIRKNGFKLLVYPKMDKLLLFDLNNDPEEINNLADDPKYSNKVKTMFDELLKLQETMDDPLDLTDIDNALIR
ncbi:sulfatase-like hydrolase/transferase [Pricia sp. S334]|uniref:Sulfatase-like hydrolase/transferase n=1 Tax=Pricia mediterranea TaxID=3076079 RepID=A0ABU3L9J9_9FLAO|nr:sulfatase-like hydrolase/transferase [Pricia sp. S334]MDT7830068.1 sulfatase-like hydrolase/transferase [Pricia sp. S334]